MKLLNVWAACLAAVLFFSAPGFSQERPSARPEARGGMPEGMEELRELVRRYHETESEAAKSEIRSSAKSILQEGQFDGHALAIARLNSLDRAADSVEREARRLGDEALLASVSSMRDMIREMLNESIAARDAAVDTRLERLFAPRRERVRPGAR